MRFYTGDEAGLIKVVTISPEKKKKEAKPAEGNKVKAAVPEGKTETWGKVDKNNEVQIMKLAVLGGERRLLVARKSGALEFWNVADGIKVNELIQEGVSPASGSARFVGLEVDPKGNILVCTSTGIITFYTYTNTDEPPIAPRRFNLGQTDLYRMRAWFDDSSVFATGGKEREMCLWDLNALLKMSEEELTEGKKLEPIWKAKNVKNDTLDLRVPVWNTDFQFIDRTRVVVGTGHGRLRVYDLAPGKNVGRRPVKDWSIRETDFGIVTSLAIGSNNEVYLTDSVGNLTCLSLESGKPIGRYKGFAGSARGIAYSHTSPSGASIIASVSLDRHLRVHESGSGARQGEQRKLLHKVYLKQRLTCVIIDESSLEEQKTEEEEEEEVWKELDTVDDEKELKKKKKRSKTEDGAERVKKVKKALG